MTIYNGSWLISYFIVTLCHCHEMLRCLVYKSDISKLSKLTTDGSSVVLWAGAALHRSWEHVHTSAAPFFRHLLLPSSQQPRNNTTASSKHETSHILTPDKLVHVFFQWQGKTHRKAEIESIVWKCLNAHCRLNQFTRNYDLESWISNSAWARALLWSFQ